MMRNLTAIAKREFFSYFNSPIAYIVIPIFLILFGLFYFFLFDIFLINTASLRTFFLWAPLIFVLFTPAITMRLIAEERRSGTIELLMTLPVTETEIIIGKFLASLGLVVIAVLLTISYPVIISFLGNLDIGPVIGGYLGLILLGAAYISLGLLTSTLTRNQIVAFFLGLTLCLLFWILDKALFLIPDFLVNFVEYLSINYHFENIARGVVDSRDIIYYLTFITICIYLSILSLKHQRIS